MVFDRAEDADILQIQQMYSQNMLCTKINIEIYT